MNEAGNTIVKQVTTYFHISAKIELDYYNVEMSLCLILRTLMSKVGQE